MKPHTYVTALLCLCASGACSVLTEENPKFSGTESTTGDSSGDGDGQNNDSNNDSNNDGMNGGANDNPPPKPDWLIIDNIGDSTDAKVDPLGPALLLAGGGSMVDAAFEWQADLINLGDIVVLHGGEDPKLGDYLFSTIGGADSVQSLTLPPGSPAVWEPWVHWTIEHAEAVLIVGAEPSALFWKYTPVADAIERAWERGAVIGGVDAGVSQLGEFSFPNHMGPLSSDEALADPYTPSVVLERDYLSLLPLEQVLVEPGFTSEDRMGRLLTLSARLLQDNWSSEVIGLGIDKDTAMVIGPDGLGQVHGGGHVYLTHADTLANTCMPQTPLEFGPLTMYRLAAGDTATWPGANTTVAGTPISASAGATEPVDPY